MLNNGLVKEYENQKTMKIYFLIGLFFLLVILFFTLWYSFLKEIFYIVKTSRKMLQILPIDNVIRWNYFKKLIIKKSKF